MSATYLDAILDAHRTASATDRRAIDTLIELARKTETHRGFRAAIEAPTSGIHVIAEIKRRSPSKGDLNPALDPATLAGTYARGGATCLSVLTDFDHFGGSVDDLVAARDAVDLPVLRKDFTVSAHDVCDAAIMGADCVLLIVAALDDAELSDFHALATELGVDVLVETHDEAEVDRALAAGAVLIGVNQRDLHSFEVDQQRAIRVAAAIPVEVTKVAESGVRDASDARALGEAGFDAILVGESVVTSDDPAEQLGKLRNPGSAAS